ncbi:MAG: hypothetical protein HYS86_02030 [Candidatus Chisholmbacteria bacterium]|nr:hypothetical protein [Candidatus Chisholmbacteria bacterium]
MSKSLLQVPVETNLREQAARAAADMGFSSLQESVRVFLKQLAERSVRVKFEPSVRLSAKNDRRYAKMIAEVKSGKVKTKSFDNVDSLLEYLNS